VNAASTPFLSQPKRDEKFRDEKKGNATYMGLLKKLNGISASNPSVVSPKIELRLLSLRLQSSECTVVQKRLCKAKNSSTLTLSAKAEKELPPFAKKSPKLTNLARKLET